MPRHMAWPVVAGHGHHQVAVLDFAFEPLPAAETPAAASKVNSAQNEQQQHQQQAASAATAAAAAGDAGGTPHAESTSSLMHTSLILSRALLWDGYGRPKHSKGTRSAAQHPAKETAQAELGDGEGITPPLSCPAAAAAAAEDNSAAKPTSLPPSPQESTESTAKRSRLDPAANEPQSPKPQSPPPTDDGPAADWSAIADAYDMHWQQYWQRCQQAAWLDPARLDDRATEQQEGQEAAAETRFHEQLLSLYWREFEQYWRRRHAHNAKIHCSESVVRPLDASFADTTPGGEFQDQYQSPAMQLSMRASELIELYSHLGFAASLSAAREHCRQPDFAGVHARILPGARRETGARAKRGTARPPRALQEASADMSTEDAGMHSSPTPTPQEGEEERTVQTEAKEGEELTKRRREGQTSSSAAAPSTPPAGCDRGDVNGTSNSLSADQPAPLASEAASCAHPKYWGQRYRLFSRFDEGIELDEESWYSVTPEELAKHLARRCRCDLIVDAFCGAGGNAIQFAQTCERVIAIDIDPAKIALAQNNAAVYGVADRIEFVVGDFFQLVDGLRADVVFLSPPWGGPDYMDEAVYDLELSRPTVAAMCAAARGISPNLCIFLPRNTDTEQLAALAPRGARLEVEQNFLNSKLKTVSVYFGELVKQPPRLPRALR